MPKFKFVIACEKVIAEQSGPISAISMFQKMKIQLLPGVPLPEKAVSANRWFVLTMWELNHDEIGKDFAQIIRVLAPDGAIFAEHEQTFRSDDPEDRYNKLGIQFNMLPIWNEGEVQVKVWLKENEEEMGAYSFWIEHLPPEPQQ
jgi:hypothetical protein